MTSILGSILPFFLFGNVFIIRDAAPVYCNMKGFEVNVIVNSRMVRPYVITRKMKNAKQTTLHPFHSINKNKLCRMSFITFLNILCRRFLPETPQNAVKRHNIVTWPLILSDQISKYNERKLI